MKYKNFGLWFLAAFSLAITLLAAPVSPPTNLSNHGICEWAEKGGHISSGTGALPSVAATGSRYVDLSTPTAPLEYISISGAWQAVSGVGGSGGMATATLLAHIASYTDPHGASQTFTDSVTVGSGTYDSQIYHAGTGTIGIASYALLVPESATPTGDIATGTIWYDQNVNKAKCYNGTAWQDLW